MGIKYGLKFCAAVLIIGKRIIVRKMRLGLPTKWEISQWWKFSKVVKPLVGLVCLCGIGACAIGLLLVAGVVIGAILFITGSAVICWYGVGVAIAIAEVLLGMSFLRRLM